MKIRRASIPPLKVVRRVGRHGQVDVSFQELLVALCLRRRITFDVLFLIFFEDMPELGSRTSLSAGLSAMTPGPPSGWVRFLVVCGLTGAGG